MEPILALKDLIVQRGSRTILNAVTFEVAHGSFTAVVGANGAGKTTLLRSIIGMYGVLSGEILIKGAARKRYSPHELSRIVAYVPQQVESAFAYSVEEFCLLARHPHLPTLSGYRGSDYNKVREALCLTNTESLAFKDMNSLSGGERQRVVIAAALAQEPELLLLDEPSHFLDPKHADDVFSLLKTLHRKRNLSILMVTHDINAAAALAEEVVALKDGVIAFRGTGADFLQPQVLERVYGTSFTFLKHPISGQPLVLSAALGTDLMRMDV